MVDRTELEESVDADFNRIIKRYFLGGLFADDILVRKSGLLYCEDEAQLSLEYRTAIGIPRDYLSRKKSKPTNIFSTETYYGTFTKNLSGLYVDERAGIVYGGRLRPVDSTCDMVTLEDELGNDVMLLIDKLQIGSRGRDLAKIGDAIREAEENLNMEAGIKDMLDTTYD